MVKIPLSLSASRPWLPASPCTTSPPGADPHWYVTAPPRAYVIDPTFLGAACFSPPRLLEASCRTEPLGKTNSETAESESEARKAGIPSIAWLAQSWRTRFASPQTPLFIILKIRFKLKTTILNFAIKLKQVSC